MLGNLLGDSYILGMQLSVEYTYTSSHQRGDYGGRKRCRRLEISRRVDESTKVAETFDPILGILEEVAAHYVDVGCTTKDVDGAVTAEELTYLERVSELFGFSPLVFRRLKATHLGYDNDDPYVVLGVRHDASDESGRTGG